VSIDELRFVVADVWVSWAVEPLDRRGQSLARAAPLPFVSVNGFPPLCWCAAGHACGHGKVGILVRSDLRPVCVGFADACAEPTVARREPDKTRRADRPRQLVTTIDREMLGRWGYRTLRDVLQRPGAPGSRRSARASSPLHEGVDRT
jgi:hypothetical protein